jgi:hypothetical protein
MRGTWSGSGTFDVTGGGGGTVAAVLVVLAVAAAAVIAEWVTRHLWEVIGAAAGCLVLAAVVLHGLARLIRAQQDREARSWALRQAQLPGGAHQSVPAVTAVPLPGATRPELPPGQVHLHFHGLPDDGQAAIIRQALSEGQQQ